MRPKYFHGGEERFGIGETSENFVTRTVDLSSPEMNKKVKKK